MKTLRTLSVLGLLTVTTSCAFFQNPKAIKTVLDVAEVACVIALDYAGNDYREVAKFCNLAEDTIPEIRKLVEAKRLAAKKTGAAASASCSAVTTPPAASPSASVSAKPAVSVSASIAASASASAKPAPSASAKPAPAASSKASK